MATTPYQDFDTPEGEEVRTAGSFKLGGRAWTIRHRDDVPFEIVKRLMGQEPVAEDAPPEEQAAAAREVVMQTGPFFAATIIPDEKADFLAMLSEEDSPLTIGKLRPVMEYVSATIFSESDEERPTSPPRRSSPGRTQTGRTSGGSSSSRVTPRRASAG
jgi:hypothetical protein